MKIISKTFFFSITILIIGFAVPTHSQAVHSNSPFGGNVFSISNDWCTITAISNPMDGGTISGAGTFPSGQTVNISATNSSGHTFISWTEDGKVVSTSPDYTFNINSNRILTANFNSDKIPWIQTAGPVGGVVSALAASGRNLYAGMMEGGVFLSTNNGTTWTPVNNGLTNKNVTSIAVSDTIIFVGTDGGGIFRSSDNGTSWTMVTRLLTPIASVGSISVNGSNVFVAGNPGVYLSTDNGDSWNEKDSGLGNTRVCAFAFSGSKIYAGTFSSGLYLSTDNGSNWQIVNDVPASISIRSIIVNGSNILLATWGSGEIIRSTDNGSSWTSSNSGLSSSGLLSLTFKDSYYYVGASNGLFVSSDNGMNWAAASNGLTNNCINAIVANDAGIFAGTDDGVFISTNNGVNWNRCISGLTGTIISTLAMNGANLFSGDGISFAGGGNFGGIYRSSDNGISWIQKNSGITNTTINTIVTNGTNIFAGSNGDGVFISGNNGEVWTSASPASWSSKQILSFAVSGSSLFAGTYGDGIYRTSDNGISWTSVSTGLTDKNIFSLTASNTKIFAGTFRGLLFSADNGNSWTEIIDPLIKSITVSWPIESLATNGSNIFFGCYPGIFRSTDNGSSWSQVLNINDGITFTHATGLKIIGSNIFAGTNLGLFLSTDNGTNWTKINYGWNNMSVLSFVQNGTDLYVGTDGNGVWKRNFLDLLSSDEYEVATSSLPVNSGTTFGSGYYKTGSQILVYSRAAAGYKFVDWSENGNIISTDSSYSFVLNNKRNLVANFKSISAIALVGITSPIGGESWLIGSQHNITWTSSSITNIKIEYTTDNGSSWSIIVSSLSAALFSYSWLIPNTPSSGCKVRISDTNDPTVNSSSSNTFTITLTSAKSLTITKPTGGESWPAGSQQTITWKSSNIVNVKLEYSTNNGTSWSTIAISIPAGNGSYNWTVPNNPSTNCRVGISDVDDQTIFVVSENAFTILQSSAKTLSISGPAGGESWLTGSQHNITWTSSSITNVKIEYSTDNGSSWSTVVSSVTAASGSYSWLIPNTPSSNCKVRISDASDPTFSIASASITLFTYPSSISISRSIAFSGNNNQNYYKLVGLPGQTNISLSTMMSGTQKTDWNAYWDDGSSSNYQKEYDGTGTFNFTPGNAFWIISKNPVTVSRTVNTVTLSSDLTYSIPLHIGWNLISNPFEQSVLWSNIISLNSITQPIWSFNTDYSQSSSFDPYAGYYYYNNTSLTALKIPYKNTLGKSTEEKSEGVQISLKSNNVKIDAVEMRYDSRGKNDLDIYDIYSPGNDFVAEAISIFHPEGKERENELKVDVRPAIGEGQEYYLEIKNENSEKLKLNVDRNTINESINLVDDALRQIYQLNGEIVLNSISKCKIYRLIIGKDAYIEKLKDEYRPAEFQLYQNYPNPFNPTSQIRFALPKPSSITLNVYNILGQSVECLIRNEQYQPGNYEIQFSGKGLASGVYILQLRADEEVKNIKMQLLK